MAKHLVETESSDGRLRARLGHPLVGDVLRDALPDPKRRRLLRALADAVDGDGDGDSDGEITRNCCAS